jgi:hypothetical protein
MNRITRLLTIVLLLLLLTAAWIWWNQPRKVDMAAYVPQDALIYVEANSILDIAAALTSTEAWRNLAPLLGMGFNSQPQNWLTSFTRITGIGSTQNVIVTRAQVALVLLDLESTTTDGTLALKPLAALVVETHTSSLRIKPTIEQLLGDFARQAYGAPSLERLKKDQSEFVKWISPDGKRQIVLAIDGSVAIIGNSEQAVAACLAVRRGQKPSLAAQSGLEEMRGRVRAGSALAFGYISAASAPQLLPELAPSLVLNKLPDIVKKCIAMSAPRLTGSIGWTAHPFAGGIEDVYAISLAPDTLGRLQPTFKANGPHQLEPAWSFLPVETSSVTDYNFVAPAAVWEAMIASIAAEQHDVICAVGFKQLSSQALIPYGIDQPDSFLRAIKPVVLTARLDADSVRSVIIAGVADEGALRQFISRTFGKVRTEQVDNHELLVSDDEQAGASFVAGYFLLGSPEDLRRCLSGVAKGKAAGKGSAGWSLLTDETSSVTASNVITFAHDQERIRGMIATIAKFRGRDTSASSSVEIDRIIRQLPYAVTETKLESYGLVRRTRSPFGQFGSIVSLLSPDQTH